MNAVLDQAAELERNLDDTPTPAEDAIVLTKFLKELEADQRAHAVRQAYWTKCDQAYMGEIKRSKAQDADVFPRYLWQNGEALCANMIDERPKSHILARDPRKAQNAKCFERVLSYQESEDDYENQLIAFFRQGIVRGATALKNPWVLDKRTIRKREWGPQGELPSQLKTTYHPRASTVAVDVNDLILDSRATSWRNMRRVFYRTYATLDELRENPNYRNLDKLESITLGEQQVSQTSSSTIGYTQTGGPSPAPSKQGLYEILERWDDHAGLVVVAERAVVIRSGASPFDHGRIPFSYATPNPELFQAGGISLMATLADVQTAMWRLLNAGLTNAEAMAAFVLFYQRDSVDKNDLDIFPGAKIGVDVMSAFEPFRPPTEVLTASQSMIDQLKGEMQSVSPANAYITGAQNSSIDNRTATGVSLIQSAAQKLIMLMKRQMMIAVENSSRQRMWLNQQLLDRAVPVLLGDAAEGYTIVPPEMIQGDYDFIFEDVAESLNQSQQRADVLAKSQALEQIGAAYVGAHAVPGVPPLLDYEAIVKDLSEAFNEPADKYLAKQATGSAPVGLPGVGLQPPGPPLLGGSGGGPPPGQPPVLPPAAPPPA